MDDDYATMDGEYIFTAKVLLPIMRAMTLGAVLFFKGIEEELKTIRAGGDPDNNFIELVLDAYSNAIIGEGIIKDKEHRFTLLTDSKDPKKISFIDCLECTLGCMYGDFFEYYLSLRGLPPHAYTEERARTNKALAENYLKKSRVGGDIGDVLVTIKDTYFSKLNNEEEAFKAFKYIMYRTLEYIYIPAKKSGLLDARGVENYYPLPN